MNFEEAVLQSKGDPVSLAKRLWPHVTLYNKQREIARSVWYDDETIVPAANMMGKDFVAGLIVLVFFLTRHPCRIVTTSAKDDHLRVLWGEIGRYVQSCVVPLDAKQGGPLLLKHQEINKIYNGQRCPLSYVKGMVASNDSIAAMQGHHIANTGDGIPRTLFVADECSSVQDEYYKLASTWMNRFLAIGNTWPCENFFRKAVKEGSKKSKDGSRYYRKVIRIKAEDSPNVRYQLARIALGLKSNGRMLVPGVKSYDEYIKNRETWDAIQQCVSLDAEFYEGAETKLYPAEWLNAAETYAASLSGRHRQAKAIGVDPGEGIAETALAVVDEYGLIEMVAKRTPNTTDIIGLVISLAMKHNVPAHKICIDRGGGGKQLSDYLTDKGWPVRTVGFGETVIADPKRGLAMIADRIDQKEERYAYKNRRAEMYGMLRELLNPAIPHHGGLTGFALPAHYQELRRQLSPLPRWEDEEGRLYLPPKQRKSGDEFSNSTNRKNIVTINSLLGCSPDQADALVLAVYGMMSKSRRAVAGIL